MYLHGPLKCPLYNTWREGGKEGGREAGREGGREGGRNVIVVINHQLACTARVTVVVPCVCVCVCVCVLCVCVEDRKELELRGVCPRHLCVRPPRYTCTSIRAAIIDTWPTNYWF